MKIGLFGGTFDPVHIGHLVLAENVRELFSLDKVVLIPNASPPHKNLKRVTPARLRMKMLRSAVQGNPHFEVSSVELDRAKPSYTLETIKEFRKRYSKNALYFIVGSDSIFEMHSWYKVDELVKLCRFVFVFRPGFLIRDQSAQDLKLSTGTFRILTQNAVQMNPVGLSSSEIRKRVSQGRSVRYLLPEKVNRFILRHELYQEKGKLCR